MSDTGVRLALRADYLVTVLIHGGCHERTRVSSGSACVYSGTTDASQASGIAFGTALALLTIPAACIKLMACSYYLGAQRSCNVASNDMEGGGSVPRQQAAPLGTAPPSKPETAPAGRTTSSGPAAPRTARQPGRQAAGADWWHTAQTRHAQPATAPCSRRGPCGRARSQSTLPTCGYPPAHDTLCATRPLGPLAHKPVDVAWGQCARLPRGMWINWQPPMLCMWL